jgi:hypothetical protein
MSSVTCHWVEKVVSGLAVAMSCWMIPASCVAHEGTPAIQPIVEAQPAAYESDFCREAGANSETQWYCPPLEMKSAYVSLSSMSIHRGKG